MINNQHDRKTLLSLRFCFLIIFISFIPFQAFSQAPQGFNYQAIARDSKGVALANQAVSLRISILDSVVSGSSIYSEAQSATTNQFGLFTLEIGAGQVLSGSFANINWNTGNKFLKLEMDPAGGSNYILMGTTQLLSVPYALYAQKSGNALKSGNGINISNDTILNTAPDQPILLKGTGGTTISGNYPNFTLHSDSTIVYKAGSGISISNDSIKNTSPNQSVSLSGSGATTIHGSYPNFTIHSDSATLYKAGTGITISHDSIKNNIGDMLGYVFVNQYCNSGDGTILNPWKSSDSSAGIKEALKNLSPTKRVLYFTPGYYATTGAVTIDFSKLLPNLSNTYWNQAFTGAGISFIGNGAVIYINGGATLTGGKPGVYFAWKGANLFYWKFTGLQFFGVVDTSVIQWGDVNAPGPYLNAFDFDIVANNGYVNSNYSSAVSPACAIKIFEPLESRMHLVGVSATGSGVELVNATFCTINGAFSNTIIPNTNTIYPNSYGLNLINCQSNTISHVDFEVAYNGVKFDQWSIQNTFSAVFVSQCDSNGATFDNSTQVTSGKNLILSIRSGPTVELPSSTTVQKLYSPKGDPKKIDILNYFSF